MAESSLIAVTVDQMREVDRLMVEEYYITLPQMMEHAGRNLAEFSLDWLKNKQSEKNRFNIAIASGIGNNGGGGMVAARFLVNWRQNVTVILAGSPEKLKPVPVNNWKALQAMDVQIIDANTAESIQAYGNSDLIIDTIVGYNLMGELRGIPAEVVKNILHSGKDVISLDVPSGLDATSGDHHETCIRATATMTLALPKTGLMMEQAKNYTGDVYVADIGVPPLLYTQMGLTVDDPFQSNSVIKI